MAEQQNQKTTPQQDQKNGMATASLVLGIISFIIPFIALITGIVGLILGIVGNNKSKSMDGKGRTAAVVGIVLSSIGIVIGLLVFIGAFAYFGVLSPDKMLPERCQFETGFECERFIISEDETRFELTNNRGETLYVSNIKIREFDSTCLINNQEQSEFGREETVTISCQHPQKNNFMKGEKGSVDIEITYNTGTSQDEAYSVVTQGEIYAKIY